MNKYFILISMIVVSLFFSNSYAQNQPTPATCNCYKQAAYSLKSLSDKYQSYYIIVSDEKDFLYPNYIIGLELSKKVIKSPLYYFEHLNNSKIYTDFLLNGMDVETKQCVKAPLVFKTTPSKVRNKFLKMIEKNDEIDEKIRIKFREIYHNCYKEEHNNPLTFYDNGFLAFTEGYVEEAAECAEKYINLRKYQNNEHLIQPHEMLLLAQSYVELAEYSKAIDLLSEIIEKDPTNKEAYFNRSLAYFETGSFDKALIDFTLSDYEINHTSMGREASGEFTEALMSSLYNASTEAVVDFIPSLCSTAYGLGKTLWITAQTPVESTKQFANTCYEMGDCFINYCKTIDRETIEGYVDELKILYEHLDSLSDKEKGELIGYTIGKYGADIFAGGAVLKGVKAYRNLKMANRVCNLEAMAISSANKEAIVASSLKHASEREAYFKNIKLELDKQNKHIIGKHNFEKTKSEFQYKDPQKLLHKYAGKGKSVSKNEPCVPGYKEIVDFEEHIGIWKNQENTLTLPTTKGTIHYSKYGAHIIPAHPDALTK